MRRVLCAISAAVLALCSGPAMGLEKQSRPPAIRDANMDAVDQLTAESRELFAAGRYEESLEPLSNALQLSRKTLGNGPYTANVLTNLGLSYASTGRFAEAEGAYDEAAAINVQTLEAESPERLPLLINRGQLYANTDRPALALPLLQEAHALCSAHCEPGDQRAAYIRNSLAAVYRELGLRAQADAMALSAEGTGP